MADSSTAAANTLQEDPEPTGGSATAPGDHTGSYQKESAIRYRTQDIHQLLDVFITEARKVLPFDGIEYSGHSSGLHFVDGTIGDHRCDYAIRLGDQFLGDISFSRERAFQEDELETIDRLIAGLVLPLRNALRYHKAVRFALRDDLTGLRNGTAYYDSVADEIGRARRYQVPFSLLLINLDDFADINRRYGHEAGDAVLVEVAARLERQARQSDGVFRKGGDEFLVFLPNTAATAAHKAAQRIKKSLLSAPCVFADTDIRLTTSIGVVTVLPDDSAFTITSRVNRTLYHAKILGKDRIQTESGPEITRQE